MKRGVKGRTEEAGGREGGREGEACRYLGQLFGGLGYLHPELAFVHGEVFEAMHLHGGAAHVHDGGLRERRREGRRETQSVGCLFLQ